MAFFRPRRYKPPMKLAKPAEVFDPQAKILMSRDVTGFHNRDQNVKYQLQAGQIYYIDIDTAAQFISKGYAVGELPRPVSEDEAAQWRSEQTVIRPGG